MQSQEPINPVTREQIELGNTGLTKREYFAAMAMQSIINTSFMQLVDRKEIPEERIPGLLAKAAIGMADALIAELNR